MKPSNQPEAIRLGQKIMRQEIETIQALSEGLGEAFWQCAQLLCDCRGIIWITAVGTSAAIGMRFAHILTCCGARSMFLSPSDGLHGHAGIITPDDILIAMSRGGESQEVNEMVSIGNERGGKTIAFVHNVNSSLAQMCQVVLPIPSAQEYELMGYFATTSTVAFSAMCDALCAIVLEAKGITPKQFARIHPGGAVGKVLASSPEDTSLGN